VAKDCVRIGRLVGVGILGSGIAMACGSSRVSPMGFGAAGAPGPELTVCGNFTPDILASSFGLDILGCPADPSRAHSYGTNLGSGHLYWFDAWCGAGAWKAKFAEPASDIAVTPLDGPFYAKQVTVRGMPIRASAVVPDAALVRAASTVRAMLGSRINLVDELVALGVKGSILAKDQVTTNIPEYADLNRLSPATNWDTRARGLGPTPEIPVFSGAEENLLRYPEDRYQVDGVHEDIFLHEFSHSFLAMELPSLGAPFRARVTAAYDAAMRAGKYANTYAATNADEYWAEGVQDYFNANQKSIPGNGVHFWLHTNTDLRDYDPALHALIGEVFTGRPWYCADESSLR
jgi:hypothetical protein